MDIEGCTFSQGMNHYENTIWIFVFRTVLFTSKGDGSLASCVHGLDLLGGDLLVEVLGVGSTVIAGEVNH